MWLQHLFVGGLPTVNRPQRYRNLTFSPHAPWRLCLISRGFFRFRTIRTLPRFPSYPHKSSVLKAMDLKLIFLMCCLPRVLSNTTFQLLLKRKCDTSRTGKSCRANKSSPFNPGVAQHNEEDFNCAYYRA